MGVVITFANQKGGVGKSLTVSAVASILTSQKKKVMVINLDPQRNVDMAAGPGIAIKRTDVVTPSILHVLSGEKTLEQILVPTQIGDLARASSQLYQWTGSKIITKEEFSTIPNTPDGWKELYDIMSQRFAAENYESQNLHAIEKQLVELRKRYDYVLIDTNPSLTLLTLNSLYAADYVVIPAFPEDSSRQAILELWDTIQGITYYDPGRYLKVAGILMTKVSQRSVVRRLYASKYSKIADKIGTIQFNTHIRQAIAASEYLAQETDIIRYDPNGTIAEDYTQFVKELTTRIAKLEADRHG